ncbi:MAG: helix-turn-helix domain-containing protein [Gammaproteobacteria bacterium]|nr:helix-turn-helix domain-containing protein [Gammaproteobacteria bacterium]
MKPISPLCEILSRLMFEKKIRTAELARRVNLPQPTVHRIVTGSSPKPHRSSLLPLAEFFGVSIEQLRGFAPIPWLTLPENTRMTLAGWQEVPIIAWEEAAYWHHYAAQPPQAISSNNLFTDAKISNHSFVLRMNDASMAPLFPIGTFLIVDPEKSVKDRGFVVVKLKETPLPVFRQLLIDGSQRYIKPISPEFEHFSMTPLKEEDYICGTLAQMKINFA